MDDCSLTSAVDPSAVDPVADSHHVHTPAIVADPDPRRAAGEPHHRYECRSALKVEKRDILGMWEGIRWEQRIHTACSEYGGRGLSAKEGVDKALKYQAGAPAQDPCSYDIAEIRSCCIALAKACLCGASYCNLSQLVSTHCQQGQTPPSPERIEPLGDVIKWPLDPPKPRFNPFTCEEHLDLCFTCCLRCYQGTELKDCQNGCGLQNVTCVAQEGRFLRGEARPYLPRADCWWGTCAADARP